MEDNQLKTPDSNPTLGQKIDSLNQKSPKNPGKYSKMSIFLAIIFGIIVIILGERLIFDLNRFINPAIDREYTDSMNNRYQASPYSSQYEYPKAPGLSGGLEISREMDSRSAVSSERVWYKKENKGQYLMYKIIIHAALIIPIFIAAFILYYLKKESHQLKPLLVSFIISTFWLMFHLIGETINFAMDAYKSVTIYIILIILVGIFGSLAYFSQVKHNQENPQ